MLNVLRRPVAPPEPPVDLSKVDHAWLSPKGKVHPVEAYSHSDYAAQKLGGIPLESNGWVRLSCRNWYGRDFTQPQLDAIFDWHLAQDLEFEAHKFALRN